MEPVQRLQGTYAQTQKPFNYIIYRNPTSVKTLWHGLCISQVAWER